MTLSNVCWFTSLAILLKEYCVVVLIRCRRLLVGLVEYMQLQDVMAWLSTLGGAYSAMGEHFCSYVSVWLSSFSLLVLDKCLKHRVQKIIFTACHTGKLKLAFISYSPDIISTSPKHFLTSKAELISQFYYYSNSSKKHHLPIGQVKNRIH